MRESRELVAAWRRLPPDEEAVLATVVATSGSTYRRPGARMLLTRDGWMAGSISGGCLESDALRTAWDRTSDGAALVTYDASADEDIVWGFGLGCNGVVQVLFERLPADGGPLAYLEYAQTSRDSSVIVTAVNGESPGFLGGLRRGSWKGRPVRFDLDWHCQRGTETVDFEGVSYLVEGLVPPRALVVFGAGYDAVPVVEAAYGLGWDVTVVDWRKAYAEPSRFPQAEVVVARPDELSERLTIREDAATVVMTHNYLYDLELLRFLFASPASYIGLLGPRRRADRILGDLAAGGFVPSAEQLTKLRAPIGLDLGAEESDEIALAVVAEIQAFWNGRSGGSLNGSTAPLHRRTGGTVAGKGETLTCDLSR